MNGGAWTFRVNKGMSLEVWKEVLMMAIGETLQEVVEKGTSEARPAQGREMGG